MRFESVFRKLVFDQNRPIKNSMEKSPCTKRDEHPWHIPNGNNEKKAQRDGCALSRRIICFIRVMRTKDDGSARQGLLLA